MERMFNKAPLGQNIGRKLKIMNHWHAVGMRPDKFRTYLWSNKDSF
ncbi:MAG: hypothetical protein JWQ63_1278 [Mucilaginibacter sp.]|nr:hypothetical protein [Mucilaginibacter sp.]